MIVEEQTVVLGIAAEKSPLDASIDLLEPPKRPTPFEESPLLSLRTREAFKELRFVTKLS